VLGFVRPGRGDKPIPPRGFLGRAGHAIERGTTDGGLPGAQIRLKVNKIGPKIIPPRAKDYREHRTK
jgi:hypothetical protein